MRSLTSEHRGLTAKDRAFSTGNPTVRRNDRTPCFDTRARKYRHLPIIYAPIESKKDLTTVANRSGWSYGIPWPASTICLT